MSSCTASPLPFLRSSFGKRWSLTSPIVTAPAFLYACLTLVYKALGSVTILSGETPTTDEAPDVVPDGVFDEAPDVVPDEDSDEDSDVVPDVVPDEDSDERRIPPLPYSKRRIPPLPCSRRRALLSYSIRLFFSSN
jgi:hypothetical protein